MQAFTGMAAVDSLGLRLNIKGRRIGISLLITVISVIGAFLVTLRTPTIDSVVDYGITAQECLDEVARLGKLVEEYKDKHSGSLPQDLSQIGGAYDNVFPVSHYKYSVSAESFEIVCSTGHANGQIVPQFHSGKLEVVFVRWPGIHETATAIPTH